MMICSKTKPLMVISIAVCFLSQGCHTSQVAPSPNAPPVKHESIEWSDIWITNADRCDLPRVLLVGDSITRGYGAGVEGHLDGKACVSRLATSKFLANPDFLAELELILNRYHCDVIHINNGLHGWDYHESQYQDGLDSVIRFLKAKAPNAKIIWALTTPVRQAKNLDQFNPDQNPRVIERNRIAREIMTRYGIPIDDLFSVVKDHPEYYAADGVHYNDDGRAALAQQVADCIRDSLNK